MTRLLQLMRPHPKPYTLHRCPGLQDVLLLDVDFMVGGGPIADIVNYPGVQAGALTPAQEKLSGRPCGLKRHSVTRVWAIGGDRISSEIHRLRRLPATPTLRLCWLPAVPPDPGTRRRHLCAKHCEDSPCARRRVCSASLTAMTKPWCLQASLARGDLVILPAFEPAESAEFDMEPDQVSCRLISSSKPEILAHSKHPRQRCCPPAPVLLSRRLTCAARVLWAVALQCERTVRVTAAPAAKETVTTEQTLLGCCRLSGVSRCAADAAPAAAGRGAVGHRGHRRGAGRAGGGHLR